MRSITLSFVARRMLLPFETANWGPFLTKKEKVALQNFQAVKAIM